MNHLPHFYEEPYFYSGHRRGRAEALLELLSDYGKVPLGLEEKILSETNIHLINRWYLLARNVHTIEAFLYRM